MELNRQKERLLIGKQCHTLGIIDSFPSATIRGSEFVCHIVCIYLIILDRLTFLHFGEADAAIVGLAAAPVAAAEPAGVAVPLKVPTTALAAPATADGVGITEGAAVAAPLAPEMTGG